MDDILFIILLWCFPILFEALECISLSEFHENKVIRENVLKKYIHHVQTYCKFHHFVEHCDHFSTSSHYLPNINLLYVLSEPVILCEI